MTITRSDLDNLEQHTLHVAVTDVERRWDDSADPYVAHVFATADVAQVGAEGATGWPVDEDVEQVAEVAYGEDTDGTDTMIAALAASGWRVVGNWAPVHATANVVAAHVVPVTGEVTVTTSAWNAATATWEVIDREPAAGGIGDVELSAEDLGCAPGTPYLVRALVSDADGAEHVLAAREVVAA